MEATAILNRTMGDLLLTMSPADVEKMAEATASSEVESAAFEGVRLDKETLKKDLLKDYRDYIANHSKQAA
jgi:hypothetical protein